MDLNVLYSNLSGTVFVPPSKSHSIRAIILASFSIGNSILDNVLKSKDVDTAIKCVKILGVEFKIIKTTDISMDIMVMPPSNGLVQTLNQCGESCIEINAENSGTVLYFLGVILSFLENKTVILKGDKSLSSRSVVALLELYSYFGIQYKANNDLYLPITIHTKKSLVKKDKPFVLTNHGSFSQPISGLLMASGIFGFALSLDLTKPGEIPYLQMTCKWLEKIGVNFNLIDYTNCRFEIPSMQKINKFNATIGGDWSGAAFPIVASVITKSDICIKNLLLNDSQGDSKIIDILKEMGVALSYLDDTLYIKKTEVLKGISIDCSNIPDLVPALALLACFADGVTKIYNAGICRFKECDRIKITQEELNKLGANITEMDDGLIITGGSTLKPSMVDSHEDHRIGMMLAIAGLAIDGGSIPTVIKNSECFDISYPSFIESIKSISGKFIFTEEGDKYEV